MWVVQITASPPPPTSPDEHQPSQLFSLPFEVSSTDAMFTNDAADNDKINPSYVRPVLSSPRNTATTLYPSQLTLSKGNIYSRGDGKEREIVCVREGEGVR
jgi:hypothetical protein